MITNPKQTIGLVHTNAGPAQLLHCYKHPRNVAIALLVAPMLDPDMTTEEWNEEEWKDVSTQFYLTAVPDKAKLMRMISSMGLCSGCVLDNIKQGLLWTRFVYIEQSVKNWQTDDTVKFGAFATSEGTSTPHAGVHTLGKMFEISFIGQISSSIHYFCPTCFHGVFYGSESISKMSLLLDIPQDRIRAYLSS